MTNRPDPHPPAPPRVHHLALGAVDVEGVAGFYASLFGLRERTRHHDGDGALRSIWLELDGGAVLMIERRSAAPRPKPAGVDDGLFLLAFSGDEADREAFAARCHGRGVAIEDRTAHTLYVRDPEDNRVAFSSHPLR